MAADYAMTQELLVSHQVYRSAAEIHGVISGQLCAEEAGYDLNLSLKILEIERGSGEVITSLLKMLADDIKAQLGAEDFAFQPLLPSDDEDIRARLAALADWCDGFNAGFAGAWVREEAAMPEQTREVLNDFSRIAQVEQEDEATERENEVNLMEIVEYVRMAAITVFLQNGPKPSRHGHDMVQPDVDIH
jgi:uncharacterized protein YgfB (UPF0149 family)